MIIKMSHKLLKLTLLTFLLIFSNIIYPAEIKKNVIVAVVNDGVILRSDIEKEITKIAGSNEVKRFANLTEKEIFELVSFMHALTGTESIWGKLGRPDKVPSGLPVD